MLEILKGSFCVAFVGIGWVANLPLAFIYGDKWDILISFFFPFYGAIVFLNS